MLLRSFLFALVFCVLSGLSLSSQTKNWSRFDWNKCSPKDFPNHFSEAYNFAFNEYKNDIYIGDYLGKYAYYLASDFSDDIQGGRLYPNNDKAFNEYIKKVLGTVIQDSANLRKLKVYLHYDQDMNASMDGSGILRINTGLFSYVKTEAELAGILSHEFGHFINRDQNKRFSRYVSSASYFTMFFSSAPWFSVQEESAADYVGLKHLRTSPYSTAGMANAFKTFKRFEVKAKLRHGKRFVNYTHPDPGERLKQVRILTSDSVNKGKKLFVVDSLRFAEIKRMASQEAFNQMFEECDFRHIIELAFTNYLFNPNDQENLAVLTEGIRRYITRLPLAADRQFIIYPYKGLQAKESANYSYISNDKSSILHYLNKGLLQISTEDLKKIKATDLADSTKTMFTTYKEALDYFTAKARDLNCAPCKVTDFFMQYKSAAVSADPVIAANNVFDCNDYISAAAAPRANLSGDLYVVFHPRVYDLTSFNINNAEAYEQLMKTYSETFKNIVGKNCYVIDELPYKDQHLLHGLYNLVVDTLDNIKLNTLPSHIISNWPDYAPELYQVFKKYNAANIYLLAMNIDHKEAEPLEVSRLASYTYVTRISPPAPGKKNITAQFNKNAGGPDVKQFIEPAAKQFKVFIETTNKLFN